MGQPRRLSIATTTILLVASVLVGFNSCSRQRETPKALPIGEGRLAVHGGSIWYKVTGTGNGVPVVLLHGGPGMSSFYLRAFEDLADDRQVVRYDQLGGGKSDKVSDTTMFNIGHFVRELDSLRAFFGVPAWHILGHSWGTILAVEYYKSYPERVASLTLASAALDIPAWEANARELVKTLTAPSQRAVQRAELTKDYADSLYQLALAEFYGMYVWRHPVQSDLDSMMASMNESIYNYMQGSSEFTITGTLRYYDATPSLKQIKVPVLYTVGEFDEANPAIIQRFASMTPGSRVVVLAGAAHITPWDARDENVHTVRVFLRTVDSLKAHTNSPANSR